MTKAVHLDMNQEVVCLEKDKQHETRLHNSAVARKKRSLRKQHLGIESRSMPTADNGKPQMPKLPKKVKFGHPSASPVTHGNGRVVQVSASEVRNKKVKMTALLKSVDRTDPTIAAEHDYLHAQALLDLASKRNHAQ